MPWTPQSYLKELQLMQSKVSGPHASEMTGRVVPGSSFADSPVLTGLNNVCACTRSHGSLCRQQPGHHNKPRKNGGVFKSFVWCRFMVKKESQTENGRKKFLH